MGQTDFSVAFSTRQQHAPFAIGAAMRDGETHEIEEGAWKAPLKSSDAAHASPEMGVGIDVFPRSGRPAPSRERTLLPGR
jgi:hypothetical protein